VNSARCSAGGAVSIYFHLCDTRRRIPTYRQNLVTPVNRRQHHVTELARKVLVNHKKLHSGIVLLFAANELSFAHLDRQEQTLTNARK
jgi:hypothetical protein